MRRSFVLSALALTLACEADPLTEIVVVADTDLAVPSGIDAIRIVATDGQREQEAIAALDSSSPRPVTLGLVSRDGTGTLDVVVAGERGGVEILRRTARVEFARGRTLALRMDLWEQCIGVLCGAADRTCGDNGCRPIAIEPAELTDWSGEPPDPMLPRDGGADGGRMPGDAGGPDAGPRDASAMSDASTSDAGPGDGGVADAGVDAPMVDAFVPECAVDGDCLPDEFSCTIESCIEGRCVREARDAACDDGVDCTSERCDAFLGCVYQTHDDRCSDDVPCTTDSCDQLEGCRHLQEHAMCGSGSYCDTTTGCSTAPTFGEVYTSVVTVRCAPCHITNTPRSGRLDMSTQEIAYTSLFTVTANCGAGVNTIVIPGDSGRSLLWRKVAAVDLCGARMPRGGAAPLDDAQISLIARWIQGGALP